MAVVVRRAEPRSRGRQGARFKAGDYTPVQRVG